MDWQSFTTVEGIASIATAVGVIVATWQLRENRKIASATFEDSFDQQYRALSYQIPVDVLLGNEPDESQKQQARELVYNYLDLCNEQIYLRTINRISKTRWQGWVSGIKYNLNQPFFKQVWNEIKSENYDCFSYLIRLESEKFTLDPKTWK